MPVNGSQWLVVAVQVNQQHLLTHNCGTGPSILSYLLFKSMKFLNSLRVRPPLSPTTITSSSSNKDSSSYTRNSTSLSFRAAYSHGYVNWLTSKMSKVSFCCRANSHRGTASFKNLRITSACIELAKLNRKVQFANRKAAIPRGPPGKGPPLPGFWHPQRRA